MYFQAEMNGNNYEVTVNETKDRWQITIVDSAKAAMSYNLPKEAHRQVEGAISFLFNNASFWIDVLGQDTEYTIYCRNAFRTLRISNEESLLHESLKHGSALSAANQLVAGMPGKIVKVFVEKGQRVEAGQALLIMEAMKMENEMRAAKACIVSDVHVAPGSTVEADAVLISFANLPK